VTSITQYCWDFNCTSQQGAVTSATCSASFCLDWSTRTLFWDIRHNIVSVTVSHIHDNRGLILPLGDPNSASPIISYHVLTSSEDERVCSGNSYMNIHSNTYPTGELYACMNINCENGDFTDSTCIGPPVIIPPSPAAPAPLVPGPPAPAAVDCALGPWTNFGACSKECNGGVYSRSRDLIQPPQNGGAPCEALDDTQPCNDYPCPPSGQMVHCKVSDWSVWSPCACISTSMQGVQGRTRNIIVSPANGGDACPAELSATATCTCPCTPARCPPSPDGPTTGAPAITTSWALAMFAGAAIGLVFLIA